MTPAEKEFKEFCDKEIEDFSTKVVDLFVTPQERATWLVIQPKFQQVFMAMTHQLGIEKSRQIINYYFEVEKRVQDLANKILKGTKSDT